MKNPCTHLRRGLTLVVGLVFTWCLATLSGCGGAASSGSDSSSFTVGGVVSNLSGGQLSLVNNGVTSFPVVVASNGGFTFYVLVPSGGSYNVTVSAQPAGQVCTVLHGHGSNISANVSNIQVLCSSTASAVSVGGSVTGLASGSSLQLIDNSDPASAVTVSGSGSSPTSFIFAQKIASGSGYAVTISSQPSGQFCSVGNAFGVGVAANVTNINVLCVDSSGTSTGAGSSGGGTTPGVPGGPGSGGAGGNGNGSTTFNIGGVVSGLSGTLTLLDNGDPASALSITADGGYTFGIPVVVGSSYVVTISSQPNGQFCSVSNESGAGVAANVTNVNVRCVANGGTSTGGGSSGGGTTPGVPGGPGSGGAGGNGNGSTTFNIGGVVSGLSGTLTLLDSSDPASALSITANGGYTFGIPVVSGSSYGVTIAAQPAGQVCSVSNATGIVGASNVSNANVVCASSTTAGSSFTVGGHITGVASGDSVTLRNGADTLTVLASGNPMAFTMGQRVPLNGSYALTASGSLSGKLCTVTNGSGVGMVANVSSVAVTCSPTTPSVGVNLLTANTRLSVGGTLSGLAGQVTLVNNNDTSSALTLTANGSFSFPTPVAAGSTYAVTVAAQPNGQLCTVSNPNTKPIFANVGNINVVCASTTYTVGGTVTGLVNGGQITLVDNGDINHPLTVSADGSFVFAQPVAAGAGYRVTVLTQQTDTTQLCAVDAGIGLNVAADVGAVAVNCTSTVPIAGSQASNPLKFAVTCNFGVPPDGNTPIDSPPITAADGNVYGVAGGGVNSGGVVYKISPNGQYAKIYDFESTGVNACSVEKTFIEAGDGNFYGVCSGGGANGVGGVYRLAPDGTFTMVHSFNSTTDPQFSRYGLTQGVDGNLYGTSYDGGSNGTGAVFKVTVTGQASATVSTVYSFSASGVFDGGNPIQTLALGSDGALYGIAAKAVGGTLTAGPGTLYKISMVGVFSVIPQTIVATNTYHPIQKMTLGTDGNLYGSTTLGGANNAGIFFRLTPAGAVTQLADMPTVSAGNSSVCSALSLASDGNFYGTLPGTTANPGGEVFQLTPGGAYSVIYSFGNTVSGTTNPHGPDGGVTQGSDGYLYGATGGQFSVTTGGGTNDGGTLYKLMP